MLLTHQARSVWPSGKRLRTPGSLMVFCLITALMLLSGSIAWSGVPDGGDHAGQQQITVRMPDASHAMTVNYTSVSAPEYRVSYFGMGTCAGEDLVIFEFENTGQLSFVSAGLVDLSRYEDGIWRVLQVEPHFAETNPFTLSPNGCDHDGQSLDPGEKLYAQWVVKDLPPGSWEMFATLNLCTEGGQCVEKYLVDFTIQGACVLPIIDLFEGELAPSHADYDWQLVYSVRGATHVRVYDNTVADPSSGIFPLWLPDEDTNYLGWWTLTAYNGSEECFTQESRELWYENLPPAGTYSGLLGSFTDVDVSQRNIIISLRDNALVDGDIVDLLINGVKVLAGYTLTGLWFEVPVQLNPGPNTVTVVALNEGGNSPNTVEIHISHVISGIPDQVSGGLLTGQSDSLIIRAP